MHILPGNAQVTKLSNNTNLETAIPLGSIAVLISRTDSSLWRTDGTSAGTFKYASNVKVANGTASDMIVLGNKLYFAGVDANGTELWVTDGTAAGTQMIKNINPNPVSNFPFPMGSSNPTEFMLLDNVIYFFADDGTHGKELWKTNGTTAGTVLVKDINPTPMVGSIYPYSLSNSFIKNNLLYFTADDGSHGTELWQTDGTDGGTNMVIDINPGTGPSNPSYFYPYGAIFLFAADDGTHGVELWKTDGTAAGTTLVKDIATGTSPDDFDPEVQVPNSSNPFGFTLFNGKVFFTADDPTLGTEGWVTDGTTGNTFLLKDFYTGMTSIFANSGYPLFLDGLFINNKMIFPVTSNNEGEELWVTDGTPGNTSLFKDINPGTPGSNSFFLLNFLNVTDETSYHTKLLNGLMFLEAKTPGAGTELWKTDGTPGGTVIVKDINPGPDSSIGGNSFTYFYMPNALYFSATDGSKGYELWKTDGTDANTSRVIDINLGPAGSNPSFIGYFNGSALFTANDGDNPNKDLDLFILNGTFIPAPLKLLEFSGTTQDRSVRLNWATTEEVNTSFFEVERSTDGNHFTAIGKVDAAKNSRDRKDYLFNDINALSAASKLYYRLRMVDEDGKFTYSKVILFSMVSENNLLTYPNPVQDELRVTFNSGNRKQLTLAIFDEGGKQVYSQKLNGAQGNNSYAINVSAFARGSYYLHISTDNGVETTKFIKK
jgi:ELWxxDGT repeat protein